MVLSEVARDPPSPFLTVQADCDSVVLPTVTPPVADVAAVVAAASRSQPAPAGPFADCSSGSSSDAVNGSRQQHQQQQQPAPPPPQLQRQYSSGSFSRRPDALAQRSNLQSIVSQQSLNLGAPPDSPLEFELALSSIAAAAGGPSEQAKHQQLLAAAAAAATGASHGGEGGCSSSSTAGHRASNGASSSAQAQHGDAWRPKGLRFLPRNHGGWLRTSKSLPQHKRQPPSPLKGAPEASASSASTLLPDHHALGRVLKVQVNKLLSWAANGSSSASSSRQSHPGALPNPSAARGASPARHSAGGAVLINAGGSVSSIQSQQQQQWPVPWQHQLFSESPVAGSHSASGVPMRSPRASLVSSPSSCDCPVFLGRYSSAGGDGYGHSYSPAGVASSSLVSSRSCSVASSPSPGKLAGPTAAASAAAAGAGDALVGGPLVATTSVRLPHYRHRQHRPGCRHYVCEQQQQQQVLSHGGGSLHLQQPSPRSQNGALPQQYQQQPSPLSHCSGMQQPLHAPVSPSTGMLQSQGSLRTALQQLESMASLKAARIMDKLNAGLLKMTSHRVFDGMAIKCSVAGREVLRDWEFGAHLGMGASCVTRLVIHRSTGRAAACKSISKQGIVRSAAVKAALLGVQREVAILQASEGHPHVVQLQAVYEDHANLHMILEWCVGGSLFSLMERCPGYRLPEASAAAATKAVLIVLAHCHSRGVMHRDIKPDNLLIAKPLDDATLLTPELIKVTDFGISLPVEHNALLEELAGTPGYMAPEVLQRRYDQQADVWSAGCMLYEMLTGRLPFPGGNSFAEYLAGILDTELDLKCAECQEVSEQARELVAAMLTKDPALRPTAQKLLDNYSSWLDMGDSHAQAQVQQQQ